MSAVPSMRVRTATAARGGTDGAATRRSGRRAHWRWLLIALALIYLFFEFSFNAELLDALGALSTHAQMLALEYHGRLVSSAGFGLLLANRILQAHSQRRRRAALVLAALAIAMPGFFYGERFAINAIARHTSLATRQRAMDLAITRRALARGAVSIRGLPYRWRHPNAADKTFLALSGLLIFSDAPFMQEVSAHRRAILGRLAERREAAVLARDWRWYRKRSDAITAAWRRYRAAGHAIARIRRHPGRASERAWAALYQRLVEQYRHYRQAEVHTRAEATQLQPTFSRQLGRFFTLYASCMGTQFCTRPAVELYNKRIRRVFPRGVPWTFWCTRIPTGQRWRCDAHAKSVRARLRILLARRFTRRSGLAWGMRFSQFIDAPEVARAARRRLSARGLALPVHWKPSERAPFNRAWAKMASREAQRRYDAAMLSRLGQGVRPGLSLARFARLPVIRARIERSAPTLGARMPPIGMGQAQFRRYFRHGVGAALAHRIRAMADARSTLGDGQVHAKRGMHYVQDMIVAPIAIALSLLFGILNACNIVLELFTLPLCEPTAQRVKFHGMALLLCATIALPLFATNSIADSAAWRASLRGVAAHHRLVADPLDWVMRVEPLTYPLTRCAYSLGHALDPGRIRELPELIGTGQKLG